MSYDHGVLNECPFRGMGKEECLVVIVVLGAGGERGMEERAATWGWDRRPVVVKATEMVKRLRRSLCI